MSASNVNLSTERLKKQVSAAGLIVNQKMPTETAPWCPSAAKGKHLLSSGPSLGMQITVAAIFVPFSALVAAKTP